MGPGSTVPGERAADFLQGPVREAGTGRDPCDRPNGTRHAQYPGGPMGTWLPSPEAITGSWFRKWLLDLAVDVGFDIAPPEAEAAPDPDNFEFTTAGEFVDPAPQSPHGGPPLQERKPTKAELLGRSTESTFPAKLATKAGGCCPSYRQAQDADCGRSGLPTYCFGAF